jgi:hypothetical protein
MKRKGAKDYLNRRDAEGAEITQRLTVGLGTWVSLVTIPE